MWRFDFAFVHLNLAIEIQGYGKGHADYMSMAKDYEKHNEAIRHGWSILYFMSHDIQEKTIESTIDYVCNTISLQTGTTPVKIAPRRTIQDIFRELRKERE